MVKLPQGKYDALPEEKKRQYRPAVRGMVRTISFATFFGSTKKERSEKMSELHDKYYEHVGSKWGLERGDVWKLLDPEERQKRKRLTKQQAHEKKMAEEAKAKAQKEAKEANEIKDAAVKEKDAVIKEKDAAVKEKDDALRLRDTGSSASLHFIKQKGNRQAEAGERRSSEGGGCFAVGHLNPVPECGEICQGPARYHLYHTIRRDRKAVLASEEPSSDYLGQSSINSAGTGSHSNERDRQGL